MKIKHYLYNAFIIESGKTKIAIDPGLDPWIWRLKNLIPKTEWPGVTHILVTHGDIDHYWSPDKMAEVSDAYLICGKDLARQEGNETYVLDPRNRGIQYSTRMEKVCPLEVGDAVMLDGVGIEGFKAVHGPLTLEFFFGLAKVTETPGPGGRVGIGSIGFKVTVDGKTIVNMGDTVLLEEEWKGLEGLEPDVLMIPIGGREIPNTVDEEEALEVVKLMSPKMVIPCHYNNDFLWIKNANPADHKMFKREVEKMGLACTIMQYGDEIVV